MRDESRDIQVLRELTRQYAERAADPVQEERRQLWRAHYSLKHVRPPIICRFGMWNAWPKHVFSDENMQCKTPFYREHERALRILLFHDYVGDDFVLEPWITQYATFKTPSGHSGEAWGASHEIDRPEMEDGAWKARPALEDWSDVERLVAPRHEIDEQATASDVQRLQDAVGDILEVNVDRTPVLSGPAGDLSSTVSGLRGLDQIMHDMYDAPEELHRLLAFLRDGVLANNQQAEDAGDYSLTSGFNQAMCYADELESPKANSGPRKRSDIWGFASAQEYTLVSPRQTNEFNFQYQLPILEKFGLVHYGCCEDLTNKIDMIRPLKNLRCIAVAPLADVYRCADQIGTDYCVSWRPNPAEMVGTNWDEARIRSIISNGLSAFKGGFVHISLKDVETVQGELDRYPRWVRIVRELAAKF